ncbi:hypothetical protein C8Q77DRAFT_1162452 [Trametes polyzona]|nr:hypothetical protein C8Q77DRAFT_1162435 [Trametes polyzona]KAI0628150.1 hypothetical protein C8Q77DRAFT_1162444 [Trametes polyzona]KAI0628157.1 hypothetical protein C8Q77DRAFT_1162452 [Trametes polyzona]
MPGACDHDALNRLPPLDCIQHTTSSTMPISADSQEIMLSIFNAGANARFTFKWAAFITAMNEMGFDVVQRDGVKIRFSVPSSWGGGSFTMHSVSDPKSQEVLDPLSAPFHASLLVFAYALLAAQAEFGPGSKRNNHDDMDAGASCSGLNGCFGGKSKEASRPGSSVQGMNVAEMEGSINVVKVVRRTRASRASS